MSKRVWLFILATAALTRPCAADNLESVSWDRPARRLENGSGARETPMRWDTLVFSADGKSLAGTGERRREELSAASKRLLEQQVDRPWEVIEQWDLQTYRATRAGLVSHVAAHKVALRMTDNGKVVYGHGQLNQYRDQAPKKDRMPTGNKVQVALATQGGITYWPPGDSRPEFLKIDAAPTGIVLGSHLSTDGQSFWIAKPDGLQAFTIETKQTTPKDPSVPKTKYYRAQPRGETIAAPTTFQTPAFFSPDGSCFVASDESGGMVVWDVKAKKLRCRTSAPAEGRAAVATISHDNRRLFVSSPAAKSRIHVYDASSGKEMAQFGAPNAAIVSMDSSADGESVAYCTGGVAYIHDSAMKGEVTLRLDEGERVSCVAISPDGRAIAGGGLDGAVRLWQASLPPDTPVARKPDAAEAPLVALGPRRATVTSGTGEVSKMWLVRLTPGMALLRKNPGGSLLKFPASSAKLTKIEADGSTWQLNTTTKVYTGPTLAMTEQAAPDGTAKPVSPEEEALHLLLGARRRLSALVSLTEQAENDAAIGAIRRQAVSFERYLKGRPAPGADAAEIYGELARAADELAQAAATRRKALDALNRQAIALTHERAAESDYHMLSKIAGAALMFVGSLPVRGDKIGTIRDEWGVHDIYEEVASSPELVEAGLFHNLSEAAAYRKRQAQMEAAEQLGKAEAGQALFKALKQRETAIKQVQDRWQTAATRDFGLQAIPAQSGELPATKSRRAADMQPLLDALTEQVRRDRGRTSRDDPFDLVEVLLLKSLVRESADTDAEIAYRLAREAAALIPLVPPGDIFNCDRATLLSAAASIIMTRAVELESGDCGLGETYSEKAAFAVALLDRALAQTPDDPGGRLGEQRAAALAQCGRMDEALGQARGVVAKQPNLATAHYLLARLECFAGNVDAGLDQLERAVVTLGFRDLVDVRKRAEFPKSHPRYKSLTELKLKVTSHVDPVGKGRVVVTNEGVFPLHNVRLRLQYRGGSPFASGRTKPGQKPGKEAGGSKPKGQGGAARVVEAALQRLAPGESYVLFTEPDLVVELQIKTSKDSGKTRHWSGGKLTVSAPQQGKEDFEIDTPIRGGL